MVNKKAAQVLLWVVVVSCLLLPFACGACGARSAGAQETDMDYPVMTSALLTGGGFIPSEMLEEPWMLETSWSSRSAFKAFGSVASDDPIAGLSLSYSNDDWDVFLLGVEELGTHDAGVIADFGDLIVQKKFKLGSWDGMAGTEIFYGPAYRGGQSSTFIGPLGSLGRDLSGGWSFEVGGQYVGTYHTAYDGGDRLYFYGEFSWEYEKGSFSTGFSIGGIASEKERYSVYADPWISVKVSKVKLKLAVLRSESDSRGGKFGIPATPTISASWSF